MSINRCMDKVVAHIYNGILLTIKRNKVELVELRQITYVHMCVHTHTHTHTESRKMVLMNLFPGPEWRRRHREWTYRHRGARGEGPNWENSTDIRVYYRE